jgi:hypothetical protein
LLTFGKNPLLVLVRRYITRLKETKKVYIKLFTVNPVSASPLTRTENKPANKVIIIMLSFTMIFKLTLLDFVLIERLQRRTAIITHPTISRRK